MLFLLFVDYIKETVTKSGYKERYICILTTLYRFNLDFNRHILYTCGVIVVILGFVLVYCNSI